MRSEMIRPAQEVSEFVCLSCSRPLGFSRDGLSCPYCNLRYPIQDNIYQFVNTPYYWGELEESQLTALNQKALEEGWRAAVAAFFAERDQTRYDSVSDPARTNCLSLASPEQYGAALDVGCGMGIHTVALARCFERAYALDLVRERLRFTSIRVKQEGLANVCLLRASVASIPLRDGMLDFILMNGILEWVGEWIREGSPRDAQLQVLRQLHSKLRPGGQLLIGIENRFGYGFFRGRRDHSGIPFTSLLPRPMAHLVTYSCGRKEYRHQPLEFLSQTYRTYTYSAFGYRHLLQEAGFQEIQFFHCWPGYNLPIMICPLEDHQALKQIVRDNLLGNTPQKRLKRWLALTAIRTRCWHLIAPSFLILCRR